MSLNFTFSFLIAVSLTVLPLQHSLPLFVFVTTTFSPALTSGGGGERFLSSAVSELLSVPLGNPGGCSCSSTCPMLTRSATRTRSGPRCSGRSSPRSPGSCRCTPGQAMEVSLAQPHIHTHTNCSSTGCHSQDPAHQQRSH